MLALLSQDLSFFMIGLLYAFRSLTINALEIPSGALADGYGRRVTMMSSLVAYILSFSVFGLATNVPLLFLAMFLYGVGEAFRTGTHKSMIFEWLKLRGEQDQRTRVYGITRSWSKFGSAVSALIAGGLVLATNDYSSVFLFATIPYIANLVNLIGYPAELDGLVYRESLWDSFSSLGSRIRRTIKSSWKKPDLRGLFVGSMAWEGVYNAIKDYIQPALVLLVTAKVVSDAAPDASIEVVAGGDKIISTGAVIAVSLTYTLLFFASGLASRKAGDLVKQRGSEVAASKLHWQDNLGLFALLMLVDLASFNLGVVSLFVLLAIVQNFWRPILISRFDQHADASKKATVLSLESQSQRLMTLAVGPIAGLLVDMTLHTKLPGHFWPLALLGGAAAAAILWSQYRVTPQG